MVFKKNQLTKLSIIASIMVCFTSNGWAEGNVITKAKAVIIADKEAKRLEYNIKEMNTAITKHSHYWNECLPIGDSSDPYTFNRQKNLKAKNIGLSIMI
jgi:hypothetical protein